MKLLTNLFAIVAFSCFAHAATTTTTTSGGGGGGGGSVKKIDAERAATAFLKNLAFYYEGGANFTRSFPNGTYEEVGQRFTLQNGRITRLSVAIFPSEDENPWKEIPLPKGGLEGLPRNTVGEAQNFNLWVEGIGENGYASFGQFYDSLFEDNEQIEVVLRPADEMLTILIPESQLPRGVNPNNLSLSFNGNSSGYDSNLGGFRLWVDPLTDGKFVLYDRTTGFEYPFVFEDEKPEVLPAGINFTYVGGVVKLNFNEFKEASFSNQELKSIVLRNGKPVPAKTYFADLDENGLYLYTYNLIGKVEIFRVDDSGNRVLVLEKVMDPNDNWNSLQLDPGYGKVIITVTGEVSEGTDGFYVQYYLQVVK